MCVYNELLSILPRLEHALLNKSVVNAVFLIFTKQTSLSVCLVFYSFEEGGGRLTNI